MIKIIKTKNSISEGKLLKLDFEIKKLLMTDIIKNGMIEKITIFLT